MKSVLFVITLLPLVFCSPRREVMKQNRAAAMQHISDFQTQANYNMGASISHQLDSLLKGEQPYYTSGSGGMSGGFNPGTGSLSGSGGSSGGFNSGTGSLSGSGGSSGGLNPGTVHIPQYKNMDVLLVLDSSASVGSDAFDDAKMAAKTIIQYINNRSPIQQTGSRVGVIEYSSTSLTSFAFHIGTYNMLWNVLSAVERVTYDNGPATATAVALRQAKTEIEQHDNTNNMKLVWIVTDGHSNEGGNPIPVADQLKAMNVTICAVGVGTRINRVEINGMASPNCAYYPTNFANFVQSVEFAYAIINGTSFFKDIQFGKK